MMETNFTKIRKVMQWTMVLALAIFTQVSATAQSCACKGSIQVSVGSNGTAEVTAAMLLADGNTCGGGSLTVSVMLTPTGAPIPGSPFVDCSHIGKTLYGKVDNGTNSCWSTLTVEDKMPPILTCPTGPLAVTCADFENYAPTVTDNCPGGLVINQIGEDVEVNNNCTSSTLPSNVIKRVTRRYQAVDASGNRSAMCDFTFDITAIASLSDIALPAATVSLECDGNWAKLPNGNPSPLATGLAPGTGVPTLNGVALFPNTGNDPCKLAVSYTDSDPIRVGCTTKIMRAWTVYEWTCLGRALNPPFIQTIEISDNIAPVVAPLADITASTSNHRCEGVVTFPNPLATDNCSAASQITSNINIFANGDFNQPAGFLRHPNRTITLPVGAHKAIYITEDACGNSKRDTINITIIDNTPPVAICNELTTVGLTLDGQAHVAATSFDDGSFDECQLAKLVVRRMNHDNCQPCDIPTLPGFTYLGTHGTGSAQRYFYLSAHTATALVAQKTAVAVGGALVNYNSTPAKMSAVRGFVNGTFPNSLFFIHGVNVDHSTGLAGHPRVSNATELQRYVVEISDICGFSSHAKFCCADIDNNPMVILRAIDAAGNHNECMVSVVVQDKIGPRITCPDHMTVNCDFIYDETNLSKDFGWPVATDNCEILTITTDSTINIDACGRGSIVRNFMVTDMGGRTATCSQTIDFVPQGVMVYNGPTADEWPAKEVMVNGCGNPNAPEFSPDILGRPILNNGACSLVAADYTDQVFNFNQQGSPACFKILRRWTVIDWCQRMSTGAGGYRTWTFDQEIKVIDNEAPVFASLEPMVSANTFDAECQSGFINLTASATDVCTQVLTWRYSIDAFNNGTFDINVSSSDVGQTNANTINASGTYPVGMHRIVYTFEDRCGNVSTREQLFSIVNMKQPTGIVIQGLAINLVDMPVMGPMAEIWASDYDPEGKSVHPCGYDLVYSFTEVTLGTDGQMVTTPNMVFDCSQANDTVHVTIWIAALTPMGDIVQTSVNTYMNVQDNNNVCDDDQGRFVIDGTTATSNNKFVDNVAVYLEGSELMNMTNAAGEFMFMGLPQGYSFNVAPTKNDDPLNGISTLDIVMIQRHILGIEPLTDPYLLIAADVNNDGKITASDLTDLRRLILGVTNSFEKNTSWRFVDKNYIFSNIDNAQGEAFPQTYLIDALNGDMTTDFIAVKVGDINGNVEANANDKTVEPRSNKSLVLYTENVNYNANNELVIPISVSNDVNVSGMQFTIDFDASNLSLVNITPKSINVNDANFGFRNLSNGQLTFSYNGLENSLLSTDEVLFELTFLPRAEGSIMSDIQLSSSITDAQAYDSENNVMNVRWEVRNGGNDGVFELYQNTPNPFQGTTSIAFELPSDMSATLTVHDVTGKMLKVLNINGVKGQNTIQYDVNELNKGVMFYTLQAGVHTATKKMVILE